MQNPTEFIDFIHGKEPTIYRRHIEGTSTPVMNIAYDEIETANRSNCIYFLPCLGGTTLDEIDRYPAFFVDIDHDDDREISLTEFRRRSREKIDEFPLTPSLIVSTPRGFHIYWCLAEIPRGPKGSPEHLRWKDIQSRLTSFFDGDECVLQSSRCMRLPFTWHRKDPDDPRWVSVTDFSGIKYDIDDFDDRTKHLDSEIAPVVAKSVAPRTSNHSDEGFDLDNPMIRAIVRGDAGYLRDRMKPTPVTVDEREHLHAYLTREIDLHAFLGVSGNRFCCPFHVDTEPSASIFTTEKGEWFYNCFACEAKGNIRSIVRHVRKTSKSETTAFLMSALDITQRDNAWQAEWKKRFQRTRDAIWTVIPDHPELYRNVRRDLRLYDRMITVAMDHLYDDRYVSTTTGRPIFFTAFSHLAGFIDHRDLKSVRIMIANLAFHRLIHRVPDHEIPEAFRREAELHQRTAKVCLRKFRITYYEIPDMTPELLRAATERATMYREAGMTRQSFTREAVYRIFGPDIAAEVFEQGEIETTEINNDRQAEMTEHVIGRIADDGCCFEAELIDMMSERWHLGKTESRRHVKNLIPEMIKAYGLVRLRLTKALKARLGVVCSGSRIVMIPVGEVPEI